MKRCFKCESVKPLSQFYRHPKMADGHLNKCKTCTKSDVRKNYSVNREYYHEYDQMRFQRDPHRRENNRRYAKTEAGKRAQAEAARAWISRNPEKRTAHIRLGNAVRDGRVTKPKSCSRCNTETPSRFLHGHHHDYSKPLDVEWICVNCHAAEHFPNKYRNISNGKRSSADA